MADWYVVADQRFPAVQRTGLVETETKPLFDENNEPDKISAAVFLLLALNFFVWLLHLNFNMRQTLSFTLVRGIDSKIIASAALEYTSNINVPNSI